MLPNNIEVTNFPEGAGEYSIPKTKEQNGVTTYKAVFGNGNELQIDVRHQDEKKGGRIQYERHNFDVKYTVYDEERLRPATVYQWYTVARREKGSPIGTSTEVFASINPVLAWLMPQILNGEY